MFPIRKCVMHNLKAGLSLANNHLSHLMLSLLCALQKPLKNISNFPLAVGKVIESYRLLKQGTGICFEVEMELDDLISCTLPF